jgi:hypothetical protein
MVRQATRATPSLATPVWVSEVVMPEVELME